MLQPVPNSNVPRSASQSWGSEHFSIYNPFLTDSRMLEAVSVGRTEKLIGDLTNKIVRECGTAANRYILIEGNSGSGKTHFLARLCQNLRQERATSESLFVTNVSDGENVSSLSDLIKKICHALHSAYPQDFPTEWLESSLNLDSRGLQDHLRARSAHRKMLLLVESFDTALTQLGMEGQRALRAFLANDGRISIVATSKPTSRALFSDSNYRFHQLLGTSMDLSVQKVLCASGGGLKA